MSTLTETSLIYKKVIEHVGSQFTNETPIGVRRGALLRAGVPIEVVNALYAPPEKRSEHASKHYIRGIRKSIERLGELGEFMAAERLQSSFSKLLDEV